MTQASIEGSSTLEKPYHERLGTKLKRLAVSAVGLASVTYLTYMTGDMLIGDASEARGWDDVIKPIGAAALTLASVGTLFLETMKDDDGVVAYDDWPPQHEV